MLFPTILLLITVTSLFTMTHGYGIEYTEVEVVYRGRLMLSIIGREYVDKYDLNLVEYCIEPVDRLSFTIQYTITTNIYYYPHTATFTAISNTTFKPLEVYVDKPCILNLVYRLLNETTILEHGDIPLELVLHENRMVLKPVNRGGEVMGFLRLDIDQVHVTSFMRYENTTTYMYERRDLLYEPITGIPLYYMKSYSEITSRGQITYVNYVYVENEITLFKNIDRRVFEIKYIDPREEIEKSTTLIVIYYVNRSRGWPSSLFSISNQNNTITIEFSNETPCFIGIGTLDYEITSNIDMSSYRAMNGRVYYSSGKTLCKVINISIITSRVEDLVEQRDFPDKGLPPQALIESTSDLLVGSLAVSSILVISYVIIDRLSRYIFT